MLPIYCISLQRKRKERYLNLVDNFFIPLDLKVIEWKAIDGNNYYNAKDISKKNQLKLSKLGKELNKSVVATAISHRSIWREIIKRNIDAAVIIEDDVYIYKNFKEDLNSIWNNIKDDKNVNFLLLSFSNNFMINRKESEYNNEINKINHFNGLFCYLVKREGAKELLDLTSNLSYQIDIELSKKPNSYYCLKNKIAYFQNSITTIHNHRFKVFEEFFGLQILNYKILNVIDFLVVTVFSCVMIFFGLLTNLLGYKNYFFHLLNFLIFLLELKIVGGRFDELGIRINGFLNIGYYDSDEIANKFVDHILFSLMLLINFD